MKRGIVEPIRSSIIGGTICGIISALLSYTILPFPKNLTDHVVSTSIGGFMCGFFAVLLHIMVHTVKNKRAKQSS